MDLETENQEITEIESPEETDLKKRNVINAEKLVTFKKTVETTEEDEIIEKRIQD